VSFVATFLLVFVLVFRPQEIWPWLESLRLLDALTALSALGVAWDFAAGRLRHAYTGQLPFLGAFVVCSYLSTFVALHERAFSVANSRAGFAAIFMLVVMYGARTFGQLRAILALLVALAVFTSVVAIHQGQQEPVCLEIPVDETDVLETGGGTPDGRSCQYRAECVKGGRGDVDYECERVGLFKTVSVARRVRWRGQLGDPNELSVFLGASIPLLVALGFGVRRWLAILLGGAAAAVGLWAIILTQSRGGQLVVGAVFSAFFISRFGKKGLLAGLALALPVLLLGGRSDADADSSATERLELLADGVRFVVHHPVFGIGIDQFAQERNYTAHNAYLLAASELGMPGFFAWSMLLWASAKIPLTIVRSPDLTFEPRLRVFARSLVVSFLGMSLGIFFLSFTFKQLLFVWLGVCGALYGVAKDEDERFELTLGRGDFIAVASFDVLVLAAIWFYTRVKGV
jgi:hypothetical protein